MANLVVASRGASLSMATRVLLVLLFSTCLINVVYLGSHLSASSSSFNSSLHHQTSSRSNIYHPTSLLDAISLNSNNNNAQEHRVALAVPNSSSPASVFVVDNELDVKDRSREFDSTKDLDDRFVSESEESPEEPKDASKNEVKGKSEESLGETSFLEEEAEEEEGAGDNEEEVAIHERAADRLDDKEEESGDARDDDRLQENLKKNNYAAKDKLVDDQTGSSTKDDGKAEQSIEVNADSEESVEINDGEGKGKTNLALIGELEEEVSASVPDNKEGGTDAELGNQVVEGAKSDTSQGDDEGDSVGKEAREKQIYKHDASLLAGKGLVISLLEKAGVALSELDPGTVERLPTWVTIKNLYYSSGGNAEPIVHGLDTCESYRRTVAVDDQFLGISGLFNTGTNALDWTLSHNIEGRKSRWQVPWGKHRLAKVKWNNTVDDGMGLYNKTNVLPVVIIKDPFTWLQSMCHSPYAAKWRHTEAHCPNLVPNTYDREKFPLLAERESIPIKIEFDEKSTEYWESLVGLWNDWYLQYYHADYPLLIVRFEDLLFTPERLLQQIASCIGTDIRSPIKYKATSSKSHGSHTDLVHAFIKFGNAEAARVANMTVEDLRFADRALDATLMKLFDYRLSSSRPVAGIDSSTVVQ